jgi:hypothetical protein
MNSCKFNARNGLLGDLEGVLWHLQYRQLSVIFCDMNCML